MMERIVTALWMVVVAVAFVAIISILAILPVYFGYCFLGDTDAPRYQYICGHSLDIK